MVDLNFLVGHTYLTLVALVFAHPFIRSTLAMTTKIIIYSIYSQVLI